MMIIAQYISTIKAFRMLDPPGVLLDKVSRPIQKYLRYSPGESELFWLMNRERENTVSCILSGLMGDESNEMWTELNSNTGETGWTVGEEEPRYFEDMNWEPTPIDAAPGPPPLRSNAYAHLFCFRPWIFKTDRKDYRKTTSGDIVSMLLNTYDTKEIFVKELQVILAERLLASKDYDVERETRNVEMIKARFGEANIQSCDVMLKDIIESKRVDRLIQNRAENVTTPPPLFFTVCIAFHSFLVGD
jgi:anaphase-promoting complex subunit 2